MKTASFLLWYVEDEIQDYDGDESLIIIWIETRKINYQYFGLTLQELQFW